MTKSESNIRAMIAKHFSPAFYAELVGVDLLTIIRGFENDSGMVKLGNESPRRGARIWVGPADSISGLPAGLRASWRSGASLMAAARSHTPGRLYPMAAGGIV